MEKLIDNLGWNITSKLKIFLMVHRPDEISATEISSRLNRRRISERTHLTGQVGQAESQPPAHRLPARIVKPPARRFGRSSSSERPTPRRENAKGSWIFLSVDPR